MEKFSTTRVSLKWGVILGITSILLSSLFYVSNWWQNWIVTGAISFILMVIVVVISIKEYKNLKEGFITFGECLNIGIVTITTSGVISMIYDYIYKMYIDPTIIKQQMEMTKGQYEKMGMSEEQLIVAMKKAESFSSSGLTFVFGVLFIIFLGFVISVFAGIFLKKDKQTIS